MKNVQLALGLIVALVELGCSSATVTQAGEITPSVGGSGQAAVAGSTSGGASIGAGGTVGASGSATMVGGTSSTAGAGAFGGANDVGGATPTSGGTSAASGAGASSVAAGNSGLGGTSIGGMSSGGANGTAGGGQTAWGIAGGGAASTGGVATSSGGATAAGATSSAGGVLGVAGATSLVNQCGNGTLEIGEACDSGANNGLYYGNGSGCSRYCTREPNCRPSGTTVACSTACGDGNRDASEGCDDGNFTSGDGCSAGCQVEAGFACSEAVETETVPCSASPTAQCLRLAVTYRDFDGQQVSGGHPDFFFYGASATGGRTTGVVAGTSKTTCVPNAGGTKAAVPADGACPNSDASGPCLGLVAATLGNDGKPVFAKGTCPCVFTDWDRTSILGACPTSGTGSCTLPTGVTGVTDCYVTGEGSHRLRVDTTVTVIQSADSFKQWYTDSSVSTMVKDTLELAAIANSQFEFKSSGGRTLIDDIHDIFMRTGAVSLLSSGFFPLEGQARQKLCNLWPYWVSGLTSAEQCVADTGRPVTSQWDPRGSFSANPPAAGTGGPVSPVTGMMRNFHFTSEVHHLFRYTGAGSSVVFNGNDDVWVFINGKLALDLGATHERLSGTVAINATQFGLEWGKTYEIAVFHANRSLRESNFALTLPVSTRQKSRCQAQ